MNTNEFTTVIYIDGKPHNSTQLGSVIFVDHPSLPYRRCAQHTFSESSVRCLQRGGRVFTSGSWYSLSPDKE